MNRRIRARPVADAPIDGLLADVDELAKRWLVALIERAPLDRAPAIVAGAVVGDGPRLCDAVLRALADDLELRRLEPGGPLAELAARAGALGGGGSPAAIVAAIEALRRTVWLALWAELRRTEPDGTDPDLVADLAERLALVCEGLRVAGLERGGAEGHVPPAPAPAPPVVPPPPVAVTPVPVTPVAVTPGPQPAPSRAASPPPPAPQPPPVVPPTTPLVVPPPPPAPPAPPAPAPPAPPPTAAPTSESATALWVGALRDEIASASGRQLSLLLIELEDADRVIAADGAEGARATFDLFTRALRGVARGQDTLVRETEARAWLIAPGTGRAGALALGGRVAEAVASGTRWRGAPLTATVGVAVMGQDGDNATALIEAAEEARFAASASGTEVSPP